MNQIKKMYENCGIEIPIARLKIFKNDNGEIHTQLPFTAEKQIELIKWLIVHSPDTCLEDEIVACAFEDSLANIINTLWQNLTEEERKQIKEILE